MSETGHYSQHARRTVRRARQLAKEYGHATVDTDHLLLGILYETGSIGWRILNELSMDPERSGQITQKLHPAQSSSPDSIEQTPAFNDALVLAADEALWLGHHYLGTEHMLLGLTRVQGPALDLLREQALSPEQVRRRLRRLLRSGVQEINIEVAKRIGRLSELSRRVLNASEQLAEQFEHEMVGPAHLLLILAVERRSMANKVLIRLGVNADKLAEDMKTQPGLPDGSLAGVLDIAINEADRLGTHYTGTDHMLLALALHPQSARILRKYDIDPDTVIADMRQAMAPPPLPEPEQKETPSPDEAEESAGSE